MRVSVVWHNMEVCAVEQEPQEQRKDTIKVREKAAAAAAERDREKRRWNALESSGAPDGMGQGKGNPNAYAGC